ncbi:hypothetical protein [Saccharothrix lopnurensis]|uniref:Uncharacterized protein n=1 Tax=Saccharothrix lopnurensis TaxID=1670621 RepID=A0ABW1P8X8_9PSEU
MRVLPGAIPGVTDPGAVAALQPRWARTTRLLRWSAVVLPWTVAGVCAVFAVLAGSWWAVLPVSAAVAAAWVGVLRLRRGSAEPSSWLASAFLVAGCQVLLGVVPGSGLALSHSSSSGGRAAAGVLFVVAWACAISSCVLAHRANRALTTPVVPELGATDLTLTLAVRFALATPDLASARLDVGEDRLTWSARLHRGRGAGPRAERVVPFAHLRDVVVIALPPRPTPVTWLQLPDGTVLHAPPGPALLVRTAAGEWVLPVDDAPLVRELVLTRRNRWARRPATP